MLLKLLKIGRKLWLWNQNISITRYISFLIFLDSCSIAESLSMGWTSCMDLTPVKFWIAKWKGESDGDSVMSNSYPPASSVRGIFQARMLEWVATSFSRGSSPPRDWTWVSRIACRFFTVLSTGKPCHHTKFVVNPSLAIPLSCL